MVAKSDEMSINKQNFFEVATPQHSIQPTKSDTVDVARPGFIEARAAGAIKFTTVGGQDDTKDFVLGEIHPVLVKRVWSTGTAVAEGNIRILS